MSNSTLNKELTPTNYDILAKKLLGFPTKTKLDEFLLRQQNNYESENKNFWTDLDESFRKIKKEANIYEHDEEIIRARIDGQKTLDSKEEKIVYVDTLLAKKIELVLDARKAEKYRLRHLEIIEKRLNKINNTTGIRKKIFQSEINKIKNSLLRIGYEGEFNIDDINEIPKDRKKAVFQILLKYYFTIDDPENSYDDEVILEVKNVEGHIINCKRCNPNKKGEKAAKLFYKAYQYCSARKSDAKTLFKSFQKYEKNRFDLIAKYFDEFDDEFTLLNNYRYYINRLTEKDMEDELKKKKSFGIDRSTRLETLTNLLNEINNGFEFIFIGNQQTKRQSIIKDAALILTTDDYTREKSKIKFGCETTTIAYIFNAINKKFSLGGKLNSYSIGDSGLFLKSQYKYPSDRDHERDHFEFSVISRNNFAKSIERFPKYSQDENKEEYQHLRHLRRIFSRFGLL